MKQMASVCYGLGIGLLIWCLLFEKKTESENHRRSLLFWISGGLLLAVYAWRLYGSCFLHYDAFSHWGTAARYVVSSGKLPSPAVPQITFTSYPTGTACFGFYFLWLSGFTEAGFCWVQFLFSASCLLSAGAFLAKKDRFGNIILMLGCALILVRNGSPRDPLVDVTLSCAAISLYAVLHHEKKAPRHSIICALPVSAALILIKSSGIIYLLLICGLMAARYWWTHKDTQAKESLLYLLPVAAGLAAYLIWIWHVNLCFPDWENSKHSFSLPYIRSIFSRKDSTMILDILQKMVLRLVKPSRINLTPCIALLSVAVPGILCWCAKLQKTARQHACFLAEVSGIILLYFASLAVMYLFSMPTAEALRLASYDRYMGGIIDVALGMFLIFHIQHTTPALLPADTGRTNRVNWMRVGVCLACTFALLSMHITPMSFYWKHTLTDQDRQTIVYRKILSQANEDMQLEDQKNILLMSPAPADRLRHLSHLATYEMGQMQVTAKQVISMEELQCCDALLFIDCLPEECLTDEQLAYFRHSSVQSAVYNMNISWNDGK